MSLSLKSFIPAALGLSLAGCGLFPAKKPLTPETEAYCAKTGPVTFEIKLHTPNPKAPSDVLFLAGTFYNRSTDKYVGSVSPNRMMGTGVSTEFVADLNKNECRFKFDGRHRIYTIK